MILTQCAVCATELGLSLGKKCGRCSTRYCGAECQKQHWEEGGHDKLCKKIKKAGGAEQHYANYRYANAVIVAAEACAEDTKGQTCYICTQTLHWKTKEGLVRGCACRGTAGFAHVSCLAEQAKILYAEALENNLDGKAKQARWERWNTCSLCEQHHHGVVYCALSWACWKTYLGRPVTDEVRRTEDWDRIDAMMELGNGLDATTYHADALTALTVREAELAMRRRLGDDEEGILDAQSNLATAYARLERLEEAMLLRRDTHSGHLELNGEEHGKTLLAANNYASMLKDLERFEEAKSLLRKTMPVARRVLGESNDVTLRMRWIYGEALYGDPGATLDDLREAVTTLEETDRTALRVLGSAHPVAMGIDVSVRKSRAVLYYADAACERPPARADAIDAR